ncbi:MAG TPA: AraC family transcriptional regulator [Candidatus Mediterraneibacter pullicola]|uniref:AraC family transcriptional regulator n=1 Tax=Candidatus Mediterraneibacter pullicola TaxID=2838682 RepID=A0A9D2H9F4_9FIRM|nr:AraC family transcriptional regulator [Candidatus Mediterraneibacter pullicola]
MSHSQHSVKTNDIPKMNAHLLSISLSKDDQDWQSVFHTHHFTEIFFVLEGKGNFLFREGTRSIRTGDLIIIPPYIEHTEQSIPETALKYYVLGIDGVTFQTKYDATTAQIYCNFDNHSLLANLFDQIYYEIKGDQYGSDQICQHLLEVLLLRIIRTKQLIPISTNSVKMSKECAQIKEFLDTNYASHITLDTLTDLTHMNKYYMAHSFTKFTGLPPIQYLNQKRIEAACHLLTHTDYSISDIAALTGFSSQSYFTQTFRKFHHMTPNQYRQTHTKN